MYKSRNLTLKINKLVYQKVNQGICITGFSPPCLAPFPNSSAGPGCKDNISNAGTTVVKMAAMP